jgi:uncharacterized membrane protein YphA (DoxX/SURF4 family)
MLVEFDLAMLVLRVGIGLVFVAHGLQKAFGWWGGPGWQGFKGFVAYLGRSRHRRGPRSRCWPSSAAAWP